MVASWRPCNYCAKARDHGPLDSAELSFASIPSHLVDEALWWTTKVTPPLFVAAFAMDARQIGNKVYERFFIVLFLITLVYGSIVTYAMLHGWKGTPI